MPKLVGLFIYSFVRSFVHLFVCLFNGIVFQAVLLPSHVLSVWNVRILQNLTVSGAPRQKGQRVCHIMNTCHTH